MHAPSHLTPQSPLSAVVAAWLVWFAARVKNGQRARSTLDNYISDSREFAELLAMPVSSIQCGHVLAWYERYYTERSSATAFNQHKSLRACLSFARHRSLISFNPASALGISHRPAPSQPVTPDKIALFRQGLELAFKKRQTWLDTQSVSDIERVGFMSSLRALALLERTGRRIGEVCGIQTANVTLKGSAIMLPKTKTGPSVLVLSTQAHELVTEQLEAVAGRSPFLFPSPTNPQRHIDQKSVWEAHHHVCGLGGLHHVRPHDLRHGFAWAALAGGARLDVLARTLGDHIQTVERTYSQGVYVTPGMYDCAELVEAMKGAATAPTAGGAARPTITPTGHSLRHGFAWKVVGQ